MLYTRTVCMQVAKRFGREIPWVLPIEQLLQAFIWLLQVFVDTLQVRVLFTAHLYGLGVTEGAPTQPVSQLLSEEGKTICHI